MLGSEFEHFGLVFGVWEEPDSVFVMWTVLIQFLTDASQVLNQIQIDSNKSHSRSTPKLFLNPHVIWSQSFILLFLWERLSHRD